MPAAVLSYMRAANEFDIAIIGMAGRFPGASNLQEFWRNLAQGVESITHFSDEQLLDAGIPDPWIRDPRYVKAAPVLANPGAFDAEFFRFSPAEARALDPQHRILLELAHESLEDAGYDPERYPGRIGIFTGSAFNTYFLSSEAEDNLREDYIPTLVGADKDFLSTRIAYKLNLKGPSITVQTACSTSMVAVHLARQSLLCHESDMVLAGGVSVRVPHRAGYFFDGGGVVSPDGRVRAFDANANGTVFGSGGGVIVLKRLEDALADGDTIHAVIKGSAVNNDGSQKAGYTAPSVSGQAEAVIEALANAGVDAAQIGYLEAHGSGTPVGDPIEVRALTKAYRSFTNKTGFCAIGSVKTNVGHLDAAAAVTGILKTVLALKNRQIPPSLNFTQANPEIDFQSSPFYVNTELKPWSGPGPRRAGVMSTGMGGTNAHLILEEAPSTDATRVTTAQPELLVLSARTETALQQSTEHLESFLQANPSVNLADVAFTLQVGRKTYCHRRYLVASDVKDVLKILSSTDRKQTNSSCVDAGPSGSLVLLLPGVGDQYVGMAHELYQRWNVFRDELDRCAQILTKYLGEDIRQILYPASEDWKSEGGGRGIDLKKLLGRDLANSKTADKLHRTKYVQPVLFAVEYALAQLWSSLGVVPDRIVGHSMGEYVAACLSGVFSLDDALRLVSKRAELVDQLPQARMLAVLLPEADLLPMLSSDVCLSLINGAQICVVAGEARQIEELQKTLEAKGIICRPVQNGHAFHSRMMNPVVGSFRSEVEKARLSAPKIPFISNVTGRWIKPGEATDPSYWARHLNHPARFHEALHELWQLDRLTLIEAGPGRTLTVLAMQHPERKLDTRSVSSLRHSYENGSDGERLWDAIGKLWLSGLDIQWESAPRTSARRVSLPTYPFQRQDYWRPEMREKQVRPRSRGTNGIDEWFYAPTWERIGEFHPADAAQLKDSLWLIFSDRDGDGSRLQAQLEKFGAEAVFVRFGDWFYRRGNNFYELNPDLLSGYLGLFRELQARSPRSLNIIHLGAYNRRGKVTADSVSDNQRFGFHSLLYIAQAIGELRISFPVKVGIISNHLYQVTGEERLDPSMAPVAGGCAVIHKEFENVRCFNVDFADSRALKKWETRSTLSLLSEFADPSEDVIAYRGQYRWRRKYQSVALPKLSAASSSLQTTPTHLRERGVYLITGGTGGIGLTIAKYLAETCHAKLVLTKRSSFPERSSWETLQRSNSTPDAMRTTIKKLFEIEALGGEVEVTAADCSDRGQMKRAVEVALRRFGKLNGVIHAAGIVRAGLMQSTRREAAEEVLAPKISGTMLLLEALQEGKEAHLDFLVLFSSMASVNTPYAQYDYSAANAFLDAVSSYINKKNKFRTIAINWPGWKEVGQLANLDTPAGVEHWKAEALTHAISSADGVMAFRRALASHHPQVVVSPEDLQEVLRQSQTFDASTYLQPAKLNPPGVRSVAASDLPTNDVEAGLVSIWANVFGFEHVGIHDNFFEIGGHSLLAARIVTQVEKKFGQRLTLRSIFRTPTIAQLAATLQGAPAPHTVSVNSARNDGHPLLWMGGGPILRTLGKRLESEIAITAITLPDQDLSSLARPYQLKEVAERMACRILELGMREPFVLGGWSLYSLLAYQTAQQLRSGGHSVAQVVLVDPPPVPAWAPKWSQFVRRLSSFARRTGRRSKFHLSVFSNLSGGQKLAYLEELAHLAILRLQPRRWEAVRHDANIGNPRDKFEDILLQSYFHYEPGAYEGRVLLLQAQQRGPDSWNQSADWSRVASNFEVFHLPGDHVSMFHQSNAEMLAKHVRDSIQDAFHPLAGRSKPAAGVGSPADRKAATAS